MRTPITKQSSGRSATIAGNECGHSQNKARIAFALSEITQERSMKPNRIVVGSLIAVVLTLSVVVFAQVNRPFRNGTVWSIGFIRMKPGMETAYLNYVAGDWKREQDALKKDGQIISYKILQTEAHGSTDFNLMLLTEYKDLATYEKNLEKADALLQTVIGDDNKQRQGYRERLEIREVLADRIAREIVLEPSSSAKR
jgi:hypothetical protein